MNGKVAENAQFKRNSILSPQDHCQTNQKNEDGFERPLTILESFLFEDDLSQKSWDDMPERISESGHLLDRQVRFDEKVFEALDTYGDLVKLEYTCANIDCQDLSSFACKDWWRLTRLHNMLRHEHHRLLQITQHHSTDPVLIRLPAKCALPIRLVSPIVIFLHLLERGLPSSREHMDGFIHQAYQDMTVLYEANPYFGYTWAGCLSHLSVFRYVRSLATFTAPDLPCTDIVSPVSV